VATEGKAIRPIRLRSGLRFASRQPSAERNPTHADVVVMNGTAGSWATRQARWGAGSAALQGDMLVDVVEVTEVFWGTYPGGR
jgi:hypothetical protein